MAEVSVLGALARDDSLSDGTLRGLAGPLVKVPLSNNVTTSTGGTSTASVSKDSTGINNPDGTGQKAVLVAATGVPNMAVLRDQLWGRIVGVRCLRDNLATTLPFDVVIDGVPYGIDEITAYRRDNRAAAGKDVESVIVVAANLSDTVHTVEVHLAGDPSGAQSKRLEVYGWVAEAGRGYDPTPKTRFGYPMAAVSLTASLASISFSGACKGFSFYNTDSVQRTVTITELANNIYRVVPIAATSHAQLDLPVPRNLSGWKWKADAAGVVNAWAEVVQ